MDAIALALPAFSALMLAAIFHVLVVRTPEARISPLTARLAIGTAAFVCVLTAVAIVMRLGRMGG